LHFLFAFPFFIFPANPLAVLLFPVTGTLPLESIAVRLADEGVPLRAIARATSTSSEAVREKLHAAKSAGQLFDLPQEDWPPGFPRDQRALQLSRMTSQNPGAVTLAMQQVFSLTVTEVTLLMALIQNPNVAKDRLDMSDRTIDVHICHLRRQLALFHINVRTLWGYGYQLSTESRKKVMDLILRHVEDKAQPQNDPDPATA
jgi:DNA-binding winged helix-turn-helix (wHTH) protein